MKSIKNQIFLLLLLLSTTFAPVAFAAGKLVWTFDYTKWNLPEYGKPLYDKNKLETMGAYDKPNPWYNVQFTPDNEILISFLEHRYQPQLGSKAQPEKIVVLLLSRGKGELIRRVEWSIVNDFAAQARFGPRICPLPSGGYVTLINEHLQVLDSSFSVIHDRVLDVSERLYNITVPLSGKFFILGQSADRRKRTSEIINSVTFETIELFDKSYSGIADIWEDRLLSESYIDSDGIRETRFFEKQIGASQWNDLVSVQRGGYVEAKFIYNGAIVVSDPPHQKKFWLMIEDGRKSEPVSKGFIQFKSSRNAPIVANKVNRTSAIRNFFDLFDKESIEAYDLNTRQVLLETKKYTDIVDYAISPDGDNIILITKKKIELYAVYFKKDKKK